MRSMSTSWRGIVAIGVLLLAAAPAFAIETAPRITDREIVERLTRLEDGQKQLAQRMDQLDTSLNRRIDDLRADMNRRFDSLQWLFGIFITVSLAIFAAIARMLWVQNRALATHEQINESLTTEIASLKETDLRLMDQIKALIEHLKPPPHL
jgi:predicted transcriptional regulator